MTIEEFRDALVKLLGEALSLTNQQLLDELETHCDSLREEIEHDTRPPAA